MKLNSELDKEVRERIERGWEVRMDAVCWWLVCAVKTRPSGGRSLIVYMPEFQRLGEVGVCPGERDAAKPHKHAPEYLFGQKDTVTREGALRRLKSEGGMILTPLHGWREAAFRNTELCYNELHYYCMDYTAEKLGHDGWHYQFIEGVTHMKSPAKPIANCWRIEEKRSEVLSHNGAE